MERTGIWHTLKEISCEREKGLAILTAPTGSGKSWAAAQFIAEKLIEDPAAKIVFMSDMKRNLSAIDDVKKALDYAGHPELCDCIMFMDGNTSSFLTNFDASRMPTSSYIYLARHKQPNRSPSAYHVEEFDLQNTPQYKDVLLKHQIYTRRKNDIFKKRGFQDYYEARFKEAESELALAERDFRTLLRGVFMNMACETERGYRLMTGAEKLELVTNDGWWKWLPELYPSCTAPLKRCIFLTVKKSRFDVARIIVPSEDFWLSEYMNDAIVFIDEFDRSKAEFNDLILEHAAKNQIDSITLFKTLFAEPILKRQVEAALLENNEEVSKTPVFSDALLMAAQAGENNLAERTNSCADTATEIWNDLHISKRFKMDADSTTEKAFLFRDITSTKITSGPSHPSSSSSRIEIKFEEDMNKIILESQGGYSMPLALSRMEGCINRFVSIITAIAQRRLDFRGADNQQFEAAASTALAELNLHKYVFGQDQPNPVYEEMMRRIQDERARMCKERRSEATSAIRGEVSRLSVYSAGFRVNAFQNALIHETVSRVSQCTVPYTAEHLLVDLATRNLVFGLSATGEFDSVLSNYDLHYLKGELDDDYIELSPALRQAIKEDYAKATSRYDRIKTSVEKVEPLSTGTRSVSCAWREIFSDPVNAEKAERLVERRYEKAQDDKTYRKDTLYQMTAAYARFQRSATHYAGLYFTNLSPRPGSEELNLDDVEALFRLVREDVEPRLFYLDESPGKEKNWLVLVGTAGAFEKKKAKLLEDLSVGKKMFAIVPYGSGAVGQNLQFKIPSGRNPETTNSRLPSDKMDFDFIYVERPTNITPYLDNRHHPPTLKQILEYILKVEMLYESELDGVSRKELQRALKHALVSPQASAAPKFRRCHSVKVAELSMINQALGRVCRTNRKAQEILIMAPSTLLDYEQAKMVESMDGPFTPEFTALCQRFLPRKENEMAMRLTEETQAAKIQKTNRENTIQRTMILIKRFLMTKWTPRSMSEWDAVRKYLLTHPTLSVSSREAESRLALTLLLRFQEPTVSYQYSALGDFEATAVPPNPAHDWSGTVSSQAARLEQFMQIPGMRSLFEEKGYATHWEPNELVMTPQAFVNIYEGALGEVAFAHCLRGVGLILREISAPDLFELADYAFVDTEGDKVIGYGDAKHWRLISDPRDEEAEKARAHVYEKMEKLGTSKYVIANILPPGPGAYEVCEYESDGMSILAVPALVNNDGSINIKAATKIEDYLYGTDDKPTEIDL